MLPSVRGGLAVRASERKEGLECTRSTRLGPSGVGRPRVVGRKEGEGGPLKQDKRGWGEQSTLDPEEVARAPMRPGAGRSRRLGGEGCRGPRKRISEFAQNVQ